MSVASRQRQLDRLHLAKRRGHPTWEAFFADQRVKVASYFDTAAALARRALVDAEWARGRVAIEPGSATFVEGVPMVYPEIVLDIDPATLLPSPT
jgi:hypothetical protein